MTEEQKSTEQMVNEKVFPAIILGLSVIAFLLFFIEDFAGFYIYNSGGYDIYRYSWMFSEMLWWSFIYLLPLAGLFVVSGFLSFMILFKPESKYGAKFNLLFLVSFGAMVLTVFAGLIFTITSLDTTNWWYGAAYYGGVIGGGLNGIFSYLILKSRGEKIQFNLRA